MWYNILPPALIIVGAMCLPTFAMYGIHKLAIGNGYRRDMDRHFDRVMYQRDRRLMDNPYKLNGLEKISDNKDDS